MHVDETRDTSGAFLCFVFLKDGALWIFWTDVVDNRPFAAVETFRGLGVGCRTDVAGLNGAHRAICEVWVSNEKRSTRPPLSEFLIIPPKRLDETPTTFAELNPPGYYTLPSVALFEVRRVSEKEFWAKYLDDSWA